MHSFHGVPVRVGKRPSGNFYLTEKQGAAEFTPADQELVEMFALHAGIAIQNARLHQRVQELAVVDERLRISRDLHDGNALIETGAEYHGMAGVKWWSSSRPRRWGIRGEGGFSVRDGGFDLGEGRRTVPVASASLLYLF